MTYDVPENWTTAIKQGASGKYFIQYADELFKVDYSTYINFQLLRIEQELKDEIAKLDIQTRKQVKKYLSFLKRTTLSNFLSGKTIAEVQELAKQMIFDEKSFIHNVKIARILPPKGKINQRNVAKVVERINNSTELKNYSRFKGFIAGIKTGNIKIVNPEDIDLVERILVRKKIETVI